MLKKILFISFCYILFAGGAFAKDGDAAKFNVAWGGGSMKYCGATNLSFSACIGASTKTISCSTDHELYHTVIKARNGDEYAILMMVAREINEYCAYFCPTQVESCNKNKGDAWTEFAEASRGDNDCVWLCRDGNWSELKEKNNFESVSEYCEPQMLRQENYKDIGRHESGSNIEGSIPRFRQSEDNECGSNTDQEHDIILAITKYLPSGHGAYVQQLVVRADKHGWTDMTSYPSVYPAEGAPEVLVCRPGYRPSGDDCVQATRQCELEERFTNLCSDWPRDLYKSDIHEFIKKGDCYQYRCKTADEAFPGIVDKSCSKCVEFINKDGINPADGTCVHCQTGYVFDKDNVADNYCSVAKQKLTKQDMQYGIKNRAKNIDAIRKIALPQQCWTMGVTDEYANCVKEEQ